MRENIVLSDVLRSISLKCLYVSNCKNIYLRIHNSLRQSVGQNVNMYSFKMIGVCFNRNIRMYIEMSVFLRKVITNY